MWFVSGDLVLLAVAALCVLVLDARYPLFVPIDGEARFPPAVDEMLDELLGDVPFRKLRTYISCNIRRELEKFLQMFPRRLGPSKLSMDRG